MDIELFLDGIVIQSLDFSMEGSDLAMQHDLKTAVLISLFSDRRAEDDDALPDAAASKRGWWGDALGGVGAGRRIGSRLWLLSREKQLQEVVNRAREYCEEALAWLVEDKVVQSVTAEAEIVKTGLLGIRIVFDRNRATPWKLRFEFAWNEMNTIGV
jgi:phage gp46-like protein